MSKISKSSIDWKKMQSLVPPDQKAAFFAFKGKHDVYLRRVMALPAEPPKIDWASLAKECPASGMVEKLKSQYESFKVPYPEDKYSSQVDQQWSALQSEIKKYCDEMQAEIAKSKKELERIKTLPSFEHMTMETFYNMFPSERIDFVGKPSFWPHCPDEQLGWKDPNAKPEEHH